MKSAYIDSYELLKPWRDAFNSQEDGHRHIGAALEIGVRLQHLHFERERLKAAHRKSLAEIASHEKNLISRLRAFGAPTIAQHGEEKANGGG